MQNNLSDLNNHLFAQLELLGNGELSNEELEAEIKKSKAMTSISAQILKIADVQLKAIRVAEDCGLLNDEMPALLETKDSKVLAVAREKNKKKFLGAAK